MKRILIVHGSRIEAAERIAVDDLAGYLRRLFDVQPVLVHEPDDQADAVFIVGNPSTNPHTSPGWRQVGEQGVVIRRTADRALTVGGGSPAATLWAVAQLAECYGIRHLLHEDVVPPAAGPEGFHLPDVDVVREPTMSVRSWRVINDLGFGPENWGYDDYEPVLHQLAKLSYNGIHTAIYPWQPFLHLAIDGIERNWATLCYDFKYPITDDMPGRALFGDGPEYWNPDLPPRGAPYAEMAAAGERLVHRIIARANALGMQSIMPVAVLEFCAEFADLVPDAQPVHQLGRLTVVPGPDVGVDDERLFNLAAAVLRATIDTYPEVDFYWLSLPEFVSWTDVYEQAWQVLDRKYDVSSIITLEDALAEAARIGAAYYVGDKTGVDRAVKELKGKIVGLYFADKLISDPRVLPQTCKPDARFIQYTGECLYPILSRMLPAGSRAMRSLAYTPARALRRPEAFQPADITTVTTFSLHDDNIGWVPQLCTGSLHDIRVAMQKVGWDGFSTRYWMTGDHDPCLAYLAAASWDADARPATVYADHVGAICGPAAVAPMLEAFALLEAVTIDLEIHGMGFTFPVPATATRHFTTDPGEHPMGDDVVESVRERYERGAAAVRRAGPGETEAARRYLTYWRERFVFGAQYMAFVQTMRAGAASRVADDRAAALGHLDRAEEQARAAIETFAGVARDRCDMGAVAVMAQYAVRDVAALRARYAG